MARRAVLTFLSESETPDPPLNDVGLAVWEAISNVVNHAYSDSPGPMRVRVEVAPAEIELMVEDEGVGLVPRPDSPGLGLGLPLIATVCDRFDVRQTAKGGTRLCVWFKVSPAAATLPA